MVAVISVGCFFTPVHLFPPYIFYFLFFFGFFFSIFFPPKLVSTIMLTKETFHLRIDGQFGFSRE